MGTPRSGSLGLGENPTWKAVQKEINAVIADVFYATRNRAGTVAPVCDIATTATKVKTTNNTTFIAGGVPKALNATDNLWTLTGGNLATGMFRKYRLLHTGAAASVQASSDAATAAGCDFTDRPADGAAIIGVLTIQNASGADFIPGTTNLSAAGITDTYIDGTDSLELLGTIRI